MHTWERNLFPIHKRDKLVARGSGQCPYNVRNTYRTNHSQLPTAQRNRINVLQVVTQDEHALQGGPQPKVGLTPLKRLGALGTLKGRGSRGMRGAAVLEGVQGCVREEASSGERAP